MGSIIQGIMIVLKKFGEIYYDETQKGGST